jgi:hypothetical protein
MARRKLFCPSSYKTGPGFPGSSAKPKLALEPGSGNRTTHGMSAESVDADAALRCLPAFLVLARLLARQAAAEAVQQKFKLEASMDKEASDDL